MTSDWHRRKLLYASGALLCVIATGASLAAFASPGRQRQASQNTVASGAALPTAPAATGHAVTGPPGAGSVSGVTSNGIATTAMKWPPSLSATIKKWAAGPGGAALLTMTAQLGNVTQAAALNHFSEARTECGQLASSVHAAQSAPSIPDEAMQRQYASALVTLSTAAADCRSAISVRQVGDEDQDITVNHALLNRSLAGLVAGSKQLYTATAEIRTLRR